MTESDAANGTRATADELEAARLMAEALERGNAGAAGIEALAVVRLFEAVAAPGEVEEIAPRRLRGLLVRAASRPPARRAFLRALEIAATIAVLAALGTLLHRSGGGPGESVLGARADAARAAVQAVASSAGTTEMSARRVETVSDEQWRSRLDALLEEQRIARLATGGSQGTAEVGATPRATRSVPTPGGAS
ncbi:MAG TPA: hypothetical protein VMT19_10310 [Thermoanaerobaculaceae bacterium]|nr:hypothetical protein [Thermoanaerobaculaceae bacterium]